VDAVSLFMQDHVLITRKNPFFYHFFQYAIFGHFNPRRRQFNAADKLLQKWLDNVVAINDADAILRFAASQISRQRLWTITKLLERFLQTSGDLDEVRFEAQVIRSIALSRLCEMVAGHTRAKTSSGIA
jgi:hypothetical protein